MPSPNPSLSDYIRNKVLRDPKTNDVILDPLKTLGEDVMLVQSNGRVLVCRVTSMSVDFSRDSHPNINVSGIIISHTTVEGVQVESTELEFSPMPVKRKRRIEEA